MVVKWTESVVTSAGWEVNAGGYQWSDFFAASWWSLKSVWFEELLFRGALLVILIRWLGVRLGIVLSAAVFGGISLVLARFVRQHPCHDFYVCNYFCDGTDMGVCVL
jgi:uncharacterized membrane protein YwzB